MSTSHRKIKSVAKIMVPSGEVLEELILDTMKTISSLVGSTLGPGGKVVAIERQEFGVPDLVTKDGVTVYRALGFDNPVRHSIMTLARDASVRTATEAGDGTTTATILSEAFVRLVHKFCKKHPKVSPQRVVRIMQDIFKKIIEPSIKNHAIKPDLEMLRSVALCSTNGDVELTDSITKCFELTGDEGNITITEQSGPSGYRVEQLRGYPSNIGFEESTGKFFSIFLNDAANNRVYLEKPIFVLYHGVVNELATLYPILHKIGERWGGPSKNAGPHNIVVISCGFSDQCIGDIAANWPDPNSLNIYPMVAPKNIMQSGQLDFLQDIASITSSVIFDPITRPVAEGSLDDIGPELEFFEASRYRSNIVGHADPDLVIARIEELDAQLKNSEGEAETRILNERKAKLSGGIAKLVITAPTAGELREKKDRAEDATCAWRGAAMHGALPGGGWMLLKLMPEIDAHESNVNNKLQDEIVDEIMIPALMEPFKRLLENCGYSSEEIEGKAETLWGLQNDPEPVVFDAVTDTYVELRGSGVVDSVPAVLEAIRNSISIASLLGMLGGVIVFPRDTTLERQEASDSYDFYRNSGMMK